MKLKAGLIAVLLVTSRCAYFEDRSPASVDPSPELSSADASSLKARAIEADVKEDIRVRPEDAAMQALRKRVLVLPFQNRTPHGGEALGKFAADEIKKRLNSLPEFIVVNENDIQGAEYMVPATGNLNYRFIFDRAKAFGVVAVVTGTVDDLQLEEKGNQIGLFRTRYHQVTANLRVSLYDVGTERSLFSQNTSAEVTEEHTRFFGNRNPDSYEERKGQGAVSQAVDKMIPGFVKEAKRIAWMGRIAKIDVHRFFINAGELSGISKNQLLRVYGDAEPIVDQETGLLIGMAPGRFKGILRVVDFFGTDGAIAVVHSGAAFKEKDRVEVFTPPES